MNGQTYYPVYRNDTTGELWDPRTGEILIPIRSGGRRWTLIKRSIRRQLVWLAILLGSAAPLLFARW